MTDNTTTHSRTPSKELRDLAERLRAQKDEQDAKKRAARDIEVKTCATERLLIEAMRGSGTLEFTHAGYAYKAVAKTQAKTLDGQRERLHAALRKRGFGDLIYEAINSNNLSGFVEKQMARNQNRLPKWLCGLVSASEKVTLSVTQAK